MFFTAVIFTALWLLQTVFLQRFYNGMLIRSTVSTAEKIVAHSSESDIGDYIDELSRKNSILVFVTDKDGNVLYSSDEYKKMHRFREDGEKPDMKPSEKPDDMPELPPPDERAGQKMHEFDDRGSYRELPANFNRLISKLEGSEDGTAELRSDDMYICGRYIDYYGADEQAVLCLGTTLNAVGSTVHILRIQLLWVTLLSVVIAFVLAWFMARSFSRPISQLTEKAHKLAENSGDVSYREGFCSELDELSETLDDTSEKLRRSREFQNELLANVSHDLRTPLTMIKGYAEMIRDISREDEKQCAEDVAVIVDEADRLTALVNEILEYSELQMTDAEPVMSDVDLAETVRTVADNFSNLYSKDGFTFECNIAERVHIHGNASRLGRAVYNLMDNAVRHAGENKWIGVTLRIVGDKAVIEVSDRGEGIAPEELDRIWDRYYTSRQRKGKGASGLGLAIVKQTVTLHKGVCVAESEAGKGSTFRIILNMA